MPVTAFPGMVVGMIEVHTLSERYGARTAVHDLSFTARPGRVTGFLGPNGAGKTTTLRCARGLDVPTSGTATIGGVAFLSSHLMGKEAFIAVTAA
jgi:ABC-2 type transport system ATP-binding protein